MRPNEKGFEAAIEAALLGSGYFRSEPAEFDRGLGLDQEHLFAFVEVTQPSAWASLLGRYGGKLEEARLGFAKRLAHELDQRGTVDVLRHGVVDLGVSIRLAYFKPAHELTPELQTLYAANRVTVTRQFLYDRASEHLAIDLAILVNGIPTATAELKNPITNQTVEDAKRQYREDRDSANVSLSRRAVVHFAVDPDLVAMTTRLAGRATEFLPFNLGCNGGKGNPLNPDGYRTAYLWERVWARDAWLDLLCRFIHVERPDHGTAAERRAAEKVIFPRYHQWDCVLRLEAHAREHGSGQNYLIQHSAGSGKSNTIAWTAHRLASLHDPQSTKVFDKVIVITDRLVLDRQLQDTIYQFEHVRGVVQKIDQDSGQLLEALAGEQARIIITTLQKFPFVLDKIKELGERLPDRRYAVIVDEAHSSQTGESAKDLKLVLGETEEQEMTRAEAEDAGLLAEAIDEVEEALAREASHRGRQGNLSFFAFTATPKARTLEMFGVLNQDTGLYDPFHLYTMRQAIEEGFILDVLINYTTYKTIWRIEKAIREDPRYEPGKARRAIARFVSLHPSNLAQKAEIIVEHFRAHTMAKIGGRAKAMVVTSSRLHAVRYKQALDRYIAKQGYTDLHTLVAFSGGVIDKGVRHTEQGMNAFPASETAERFGTGDYQVLIVAEKFQTGFDQPLLHTMYVDKVLLGLAAVQTLSRLNRIHPLKTDTFVLDFRNETDEIVKAFEPYYGRTVAPPTDPNLLYDIRGRLDQFDVLRDAEIGVAVDALLASTSAGGGHAQVYAQLEPAVDRFRLLPEPQRFEFKDWLDKFVRLYAFLSQVVPFADTRLERDYRYCRALAPLIRDAATSERLDLGEEVELTHLRTEITSEGSLALTAQLGEVRTVYGEGMGVQDAPDQEPLSQIVEELNEKFGLALTERDQLLFDQFEGTWLADPEVVDQARSNTLENFRLVFDRRFLDTLVGRMDENEAIFRRILDDEEFQQALLAFYASRVYQRLHPRSTDHREAGSPPPSQPT
jgi:type I restriction enzyme R subunit